MRGGGYEPYLPWAAYLCVLFQYIQLFTVMEARIVVSNLKQHVGWK